MSDNENGKVTTAAAYLEDTEKSYIVKMPSGHYFKIRLPNGFWYMEKSGNLPSALLRRPLLDEPPEAAVANLTAEDRKATLDFQRVLIEECVLEPKIRRPADREKNELDPADILPTDQAFLMDYLNGVRDRTGRLLPQAGRVPGLPAAVPGSREVPPAAE